MAIKILPGDKQIKKSNFPYEIVAEIVADTEADITALGKVVSDGSRSITPLPGSMAWTADLSAVYQYSPSKTWTKVGG